MFSTQSTPDLGRCAAPTWGPSSRLELHVFVGRRVRVAADEPEPRLNGVMMPGVSAGSNQVGASEMWTPQVSWPSGAAVDETGTESTMPTRRLTAAARPATAGGSER